jgi:hypothetical protein
VPVSGAVRRACAIALLGVVALGPTAASQSEITQYYDSMKDICRLGVTPAMTAAYDRARHALEHGRASSAAGADFGGLKTPEATWLDCFQSPGDGKT